MSTAGKERFRAVSSSSARLIDFRLLFDGLANPYVVVDCDLVVVHANDKYLKSTERHLDDIVGKYIFDSFPESGESLNRFKRAFELARDGEENVVPLFPYAISRSQAHGGGFQTVYWSCTHTPIFDHAGKTAFVVQHAQDVTELYQLRESFGSTSDSRAHRLEGDVLHRATFAEARNKALMSEHGRLRLLAEAASAMPAAHTLGELVGIVRSAARNLSQADGVTFVVRDGDESHFIDEDAVEPLWKGRRFPLQECIAGRAMLQNETIAIPDIDSDERIPRAVYEPTFVKSVVMLPVGGPEPDAAVGVYRAEPHAVDSAEIASLDERFARHVATQPQSPGDSQVADVLQSATEATRSIIAAEGHRLTVSLPPEPVLLHADPSRLSQVFSNLLTNSAKYTERGGNIDIAISRRGGALKVIVKDDGIGIASEDLPNIFNMFSRSGRSAERAPEGLGVGLALAKGIIELHGGKITAESAGVGGGSVFTISLPLPKPGGAAAAADAPGDGVESQSVQRRVLVVDDNLNAVQSLALLLEALGHRVMTAADGLEAVSRAEHATLTSSSQSASRNSSGCCIKSRVGGWTECRRHFAGECIEFAAESLINPLSG